MAKYDFTTLYTTLPKEKLTELIEQPFNRKGSLKVWLVMRNVLFSLMNHLKYIICGQDRKFENVLHYPLDNIFIRFGPKLYRQIVCVPIGTICTPLVAELFLFSYERNLMLSLSDNDQAGVID